MHLVKSCPQTLQLPPESIFNRPEDWGRIFLPKRPNYLLIIYAIITNETIVCAISFVKE